MRTLERPETFVDEADSVRVSHLAKAERCICTPKTEAIRQSDTNLLLLGNLGNIIAIKVYRGISWVAQIESRRQCVLRGVSASLDNSEHWSHLHDAILTP